MPKEIGGGLSISPLPGQHTTIGFNNQHQPGLPGKHDVAVANNTISNDEMMLRATSGHFPSNLQVPQSPGSFGKKSYKNIMLDKLPKSNKFGPKTLGPGTTQQQLYMSRISEYKNVELESGALRNYNQSHNQSPQEPLQHVLSAL